MPLSPIREVTHLQLRPLEPIRRVRELAFPELEGASDLDFLGVETQHATHSLHPYVAAINPPLAASLINHYVPRGETILDPFCGGGGVLVESILNDRRALGSDINPLAVLISRAKTRWLDPISTLRTYLEVVNEAGRRQRTLTLDDIPEIVSFWYREETLAPLKALAAAIRRIPDEHHRQLFQVVLSAAARDVMLTYRGEVRLRKLQGPDLERFRPDVYAAFKRRALSAIKSVGDLPPDCDARVVDVDCRKLTKVHGCHTVITSPPYGDDKNGVGYFQFSRNMLFWLGVSLDDQRTRREEFLGCGGESQTSMPYSQTLKQTLEIISDRKAIHHREAANFYKDYFEGLKRLSSITRERIIIIIGDRVLSRTKINNGHITTEFMEELGWPLEHYYTRRLKKKRIANLGGDGGGIALEHIMVFRNPT